MLVNCANCKKEIDRRPCRIRERNYCSPSCQNEYEYSHGLRDKNKVTFKANEEMRKRGLKKFLENPTIKMGQRGYLLIYIPTLVGGKIGWRYYHHYVWEKATGIKIEKGFCIHHKDRNPLNNSIENLEYMKISEHDKIKKIRNQSSA